MVDWASTELTPVYETGPVTVEPGIPVAEVLAIGYGADEDG